MTKTKITLLTLLPIVLFTIAMTIYISSIFSFVSVAESASVSASEVGNKMLTGIMVVFIMSILVMLVNFGLLTYYTLLILENKNLTQGYKILWIVLVFMFSAIPMFVYLFKYVYGNDESVLKLDLRPSQGSKKIISGLVTCLPILFLIILYITLGRFMTGIFSQMDQLNQVENESEIISSYMAQLAGVIFIEIGLFISIMGLLIFYIIDVVRNKDLEENMKLTWGLMIFFMSYTAMVVYWAVYIYREKPAIEVCEHEAEFIDERNQE